MRELLAVIALALSIFACSSDDAGAVDQLAYTSTAGGVQHVWIADVTGANVRQLTTGAYGDSYVNWCGRDKIIYERAENGIAIYVVGVGASAIPRRLSTAASKDTKPSCSPDGQRVAYTWVYGPPVAGHQSPTGNSVTEIRVMDIDGRNVRTLVRNGAFNMEPKWGADGKLYFFSDATGNAMNVYSIGGGGPAYTQLTNTPGNVNGDPAPWGTRVAFSSNRDGGVNIWAADAATGANLLQLTHYTAPEEGGDPGPSPDGTLIAFQHDTNGNNQSDSTLPATIYLVKSDGSQAPYPTGIACAGAGCSPRFRPMR